MPSSKLAVVLSLLSWASAALAHGIVRDIWADSHRYNGWDPNGNLSAYPSSTPAWFTSNVGGGPLHPFDANTSRIICGKGGSPANMSAPVTAGSDVQLKWWMADQAWPVGHHGPILSYLAACGGSCAGVEPEALRFVKVAEREWVNASVYTEGFWATDELIAKNGSWSVRIPRDLAAGEYVLRHEIIALHVAFTSVGPYSLDGAEFYPQCVSIKVEGAGAKKISSGVDARTLYKGIEPGLALNIHNSPDHSDYVMPGPALWEGVDEGVD